MLSQPHPSLLFANRRSASPPLYSRLNHQWLLSSPKHHFEAPHSRNLPQSHSSELSLQSACPSHQSSRGTHSWLAHSSSLSSQNAAKTKTRFLLRKTWSKCNSHWDEKLRRRVKVGVDQIYGTSKWKRFATKFSMDTTEAESGCCHAVAEGIATQREARVSGNARSVIT